MGLNKDNNFNYLNQLDKKGHGFSTPQNYFDGIEDDFHIKLSEEKLPLESGFTTPQNYLSSIEAKVLSKINVKKKSKVITFNTKTTHFISYIAAASILLFFGFKYFYSTIKPENVTFDAIEFSEVENWFENNNISNNELTANFTDLDIDENDFQVDIEDSNLEDYINSIDTTYLINEIN